MAKPGVMIYFEVQTILKYGERGTEPRFDAPEMKMAWAFIKSRIDRDGGTYERKVALSKYAVYCRVEKQKGFKPLDFEMWQAAMEDPEEDIN